MRRILLPPVLFMLLFALVGHGQTISETVLYCNTSFIQLETEQGFKYEWSTGENTRSIVHDINNGNTVSVDVSSLSPSSLTNGDMDNGLSGFSSDYGSDQNINPGTHYFTSSLQNSPIQYDHTSNNGSNKFFVVSTNSSKQVILEQTGLSVQSGEDYIFSFWISTPDQNNNGTDFHVEINGDDITGTITSPLANEGWVKKEYTWTATSSSADIAFINNTSDEGRLGIDDISLAFVVKQAYEYNLEEKCFKCSEVTASDIAFCDVASFSGLTAQTESGDCDNIQWFSSETSTTPLETGCLYTPTITGKQSFWVYDITSEDGCPRKEVKAFEACYEVCGNGIDDDGDGAIDEACVPFTCNGSLYQTHGPRLKQMILDPVTFYDIAKAPTYSVNATGYNPIDNFIYANQGGKLVRFSADGTSEVLETIFTEDGTELSSIAADFSADGTYYLQGGSGIIYSVDISTMQATEVLTLPEKVWDFAFNPTNGKFYGVSETKFLYEIDVENKTTNNLGKLSGSGIGGNGGVGAAFFTPAGDLIISGALDGGSDQNDIAKVDINTLETTVLEQNGIVVSSNDGCSCSSSILIEKTASVTSASAGDTYAYTIDIYNQTGSPISNATLVDELDSRLTVKSIISNSFSAPVTGTGVGTQSIKIEDLLIPLGKSQLVFEVTVDASAVLCTGKTIANQAELQDLPARFGSKMLSDDPNTAKQNDDTKIETEGPTVCEPCKRPNQISLTGPETVMIGSPINVSATYTGTPSEEYYGSWYKNGVRISEPSTTFTDLQIDESTPNDEALYTFRLEDGNNDDSQCYLKQSIDISISQVATDLATANPLCSDYVYDFPLQTNILAENGPDYGCLASVPNPAWYYLKIAKSGEINMDLHAINDVDFIIWGPFDTIVSNPQTLTSATHIDCSYDGSEQEWPSIAHAEAGKYYMMLVTNFANEEQNFTLKQISGEGKTDCAIVADTCIAELGDDIEICKGDTAIFDAGIADSYLWSNGETTQTIEATTEDLYYVTVTQGTCTATDSVKLSIIPLPEIELGDDTIICENQLFELDAGIADSYLWSNGKSTQTIEATSEGIYYVTVTQGICNVTDSIKVSIDLLPTLNLGNDTVICEGQHLELDAGIADSYEWSSGSTDQTVIVFATETHSVTITAGACSVSDTIEVYVKDCTINKDLLVSPQDSTICKGDSISLTAQTDGFFSWFENGREINKNKEIKIAPESSTEIIARSVFESHYLLVNESFEAGNSNFTSDYQFINTGVLGQGKYAIRDDAESGYPGYFFTLKDHTTGSGKMMVVDGNTVSGSIVYEKSVNVEAGKSYVLSVWVASIRNDYINPPFLQFTIDDNPMGFLDVDSLPEWRQFYTIWEAPSDGSVNLRIENLNTIADGNDFAMDDIMFYEIDDNVLYDTVTITVSEPVALSLDETAEYCAGDSILIEADPQYDSYLWNNGKTESSIYIKTEGEYIVTAFNGACSAHDTITISEISSPIIELGNDTTLCPSATIELDATFTDATYEWNDASTDATLQVDADGEYSVTVTKDNCSFADTITVNYFDENGINLGADQALCEGDTLLLNATTAGATYLWHDGSKEATFAATESGDYEVTVTINGCESSDAISLIFNQNPTVNLGNDTTLCPSATIELDATFTNATYEWNDASTYATLNIDSDGEYIVTVTKDNCSSSDTINIDYFDEHSIDLGTDQTLCEGESLTLDATIAGATYLWNNNSTEATLEISETGVYSVTATTNGCEVTDEIAITITPLPSLDLGNDIVACKSHTIDACFGYDEYIWNNGKTTPQITVTDNGEYTVTVTDQGCSKADTILVDISNDYIVDFGYNIDHCGDTTITLNAGEGSDYIWSTSETTQTIDINTSGFYSVTVENGACQGTGSISINIKPQPEISLGDDIKSCGQYTLTAEDDFDSYLWSNTETTQSIIINESGEYSITATKDGCSATDNIYADITQPFTIDLGEDITECEGADIEIDAGEGDTYIWSSGESDQKIEITISDTYSVTVQSGNCSAEDEVAVLFIPNVTPSVTIQASETEFCEGSEITLSIADSVNLGANPTYSWLVDNEEISTNETTITSDLLGVQEIKLIATSSVLCVEDEIAESEIEVIANPNLTPLVTIEASDNGVCEGDNIDFSINSIENEGSSPTYSWFINDEFIQDKPTFGSAILQNGDRVSLQITSSEECLSQTTAIDEIEIEIFNYPQFSLGDSPLTLCSNEIAVLSPEPKTEVIWNDGSTDATKLIKAPGGEFIATANNNGCTFSDTVVVNYTSLPNFEILGAPAIYKGDTAFYEVSVEFASYLWSNSEMKRNIQVNPETNETYWVMVEDEYQCNDSSYITVEVLPRPEIGISDITFCEGESRELTVKDEFDVYEWSTGESTQSITVTEPGEYIIQASRTNEPDITLLDTIKVEVIQKPEFEITADHSICEGETATIGTDNLPLASYKWNTGQTEPTIEVHTNGVYTLSVSVFGCETSKDVSVMVKPVPANPIIDEVINICFDEELPVIQAIGTNITWHDANTSTEVTTGNTFDIFGYLGRDLNENETLTLYLQSEQDDCFSDEIETTIHRLSPQTDLQIHSEKDEFCEGDSDIPFTLEGGIEAITWTVTEANGSAIGNDFMADFNTAGNPHFSVTTMDKNGCFYRTEKTVTVHELPMVDYTVDAINGTAEFEIIPDQANTIYQWKLPNKSTWQRALQYDTVINLAYGFYSSSLKGTTPAGCTNTTTHDFFMDDAMNLFIPTGFAPDDDAEGVQLFKPVGINLELFEIWVYDNFGNTVWYSNALDENGSPTESWDGKHKDIILKTDVYKWKVKAMFVNGKIWTNNQNTNSDNAVWGAVHLIR